MQLELLSTDKEQATAQGVPFVHNLNPILFKNVPCISTETLAKAYGVGTNQIKTNYFNNKDRFVAGKHFFLIEGKELKAFKDQVKTFNLVNLPKNTAHFTLWTERGAARHAKMLNSDKAWDVFELLEETFFNQPATDLPALPADTPKKAQYIECALREALSKLEYAYQLQNFYGTPDKACKGNEEHLKFLHVSCMSNINAAAAITRALIALR